MLREPIKSYELLPNPLLFALDKCIGKENEVYCSRLNLDELYNATKNVNESQLNKCRGVGKKALLLFKMFKHYGSTRNDW